MKEPDNCYVAHVTPKTLLQALRERIAVCFTLSPDDDLSDKSQDPFSLDYAVLLPQQDWAWFGQLLRTSLPDEHQIVPDSTPA